MVQGIHTAKQQVNLSQQLHMLGETNISVTGELLLKILQFLVLDHFRLKFLDRK